MTIEPKNSVVAYRCPYCGSGVISNVGALSLTAEKISLRCHCKRSELEMEYTKDDKIKIKVPCVFCPNPHTYSVSKNALFSRELFTLSCPFTGSGTVFIGELNHVKAELSRTELELLDAMNENGIESFDDIHKKEEFTDRQIIDTIVYVIKELDEEGQIKCNCDEPSGDYDIEITNEGVSVRCNKCGASKLIPADSYVAAHSFIYTDSITLE